MLETSDIQEFSRGGKELAEQSNGIDPRKIESRANQGAHYETWATESWVRSPAKLEAGCLGVGSE